MSKWAYFTTTDLEKIRLCNLSYYSFYSTFQISNIDVNRVLQQILITKSQLLTTQVKSSYTQPCESNRKLIVAFCSLFFIAIKFYNNKSLNSFISHAFFEIYLKMCRWWKIGSILLIFLTIHSRCILIDLNEDKTTSDYHVCANEYDDPVKFGVDKLWVDPVCDIFTSLFLVYDPGARIRTGACVQQRHFEHSCRTGQSFHAADHEARRESYDCPTLPNYNDFDHKNSRG